MRCGRCWRRWQVKVVLEREQAEQVALIAADLDLPVDLCVQMLLSGPLGQMAQIPTVIGE